MKLQRIQAFVQNLKNLQRPQKLTMFQNFAKDESPNSAGKDPNSADQNSA